MKNLKNILFAFYMCVFFCTTVNAQESSSTKSLWLTINNPDYVPYLSRNNQFSSSDIQLQEIIDQYSIKDVKQAFSDSKKEKLLSVYEFDCECDEYALLEDLSKISYIQSVERAPVYELLSSTPPDDYTLSFQSDYALDLIDAIGAWSFSTGDTSVILGVSDGSYFANQEDLQSEFVSMNNMTNAPMNYYYHGTAVAVTTAGSTNNGMGKSSIGYNCRLALGTMGYNELLALSYGGARVINVSWSSGCFENLYMQEVIDEIHENGTILVAAAGNGTTCGNPEALVYPAASNNVISVTSVGPYDNHERVLGDSTSTHQHNSTVDICAPGYDVPLAIAPNFYTTANGTSFAAPMVTGTIGLMLALKPCLTYQQILRILEISSINIDELNPNYAGGLGFGRLHAGKALDYTSQVDCNSGVAFLETIESIQQVNSERDKAEIQVHSPTKFEVVSFPNPTQNDVHLKWNISQQMDVSVIDISGRTVLRKKMPHDMREMNLQLEQQGIYFVHFEKEGEIICSRKVIRL